MSPASYRAAPPRVGSRQPYVTSSTKPNRDKRALFSSINRPTINARPLRTVGLVRSTHRLIPASSRWCPWLPARGGCPLSRRLTNSHMVPKADAAAGLGRLSDRESDPCRRLGENYHENLERDRTGMAERYPQGMHGAIATGLRDLMGTAVEVRTATQDQPEH